MINSKAKAASHTLGLLETRIIAGVRTRTEKKLAIEKEDGRDNRIVYIERSSKVVWIVGVFMCSYVRIICMIRDAPPHYVCQAPVR